jgi:hypothetical protein
MPPFSPGKRLIVTGAGATVGAQFDPTFQPPCRPPLNATFFTELQRITASKYANLISEVIDDAIGLFGSNFDLTLEDYFTQLEFLAEAVKLAPQGGGAFSATDISKARDRLLHALSAVLEESTDAAIRRSGGCELHGDLVTCLQPKDTLISFNYDCVLDHALRTHGSKKWSARYGYSLPRPTRIVGAENWEPPSPATSQDTVHLLKLHGSLNWQLPDNLTDPVKLKQRLYMQRGVPVFTVIPPVWNKATADNANFAALWQYAERAIRSAEHIAVIGFSFARTDLPVQSLFRVALAKKTNLKTLAIANPSADDRRHIRDVFARPLNTGTIVRTYDDFKGFVSALPAALA